MFLTTFRAFIPVLLSCGFCGCLAKHNDNSQTLNQVTETNASTGVDADVDAAKCPDGKVPVVFLLESLTTEVDTAGMHLDPDISVFFGLNQEPHSYQKPSLERGKTYRLRVCEVNGAFNFFDILSPKGIIYSVSPTDADNTVLQKFLFDDFDGAEIKFTAAQDSVEGILVQGQKAGDQRYVSITSIFEKDGKRFTNDTIYYGKLSVKDFASISNPCAAFGDRPGSRTIKIGTTNLLFSGCASQGAGSSTIFSFNKVEITDSNAAIPSTWRN